MKIAITGKGGSGKTSISFLLAGIFKDSGYRVLLVDADSDGNLPEMMGIPSETVIPVTEMKNVIAERTGTDPDQSSPFFKLNPVVNDIPEKYAIEKNGLKLLSMGTINSGGEGCACSMSNFIRHLVRHVILENRDMVIMDMEAGIEHLGRGTTEHVDCLCIVTEPNRTGCSTGNRILKLSRDLGIVNHIIIGNKIMNEDEKKFISNNITDDEIICIPHSSLILQMSRFPDDSYQLEPEVSLALTKVKNRILHCERN